MKPTFDIRHTNEDGFTGYWIETVVLGCEDKKEFLIGADAREAIENLMQLVNEIMVDAGMKLTAGDLTERDIGNTYRITGGGNDGEIGELITVDPDDEDSMKCKIQICAGRYARCKQWIENWAKVERVEA